MNAELRQKELLESAQTEPYVFEPALKKRKRKLLVEEQISFEMSIPFYDRLGEDY